MSGEQHVEEGSVTKAIMVEGQTVVFRVSEGKKGEGHRGLSYELFSREPLGPALEESVAERISFFLSLGDDVKQLYSIARKKDEEFYPVVERCWGLHQVKFLTLLEAACWAIIVQRVQRPIALRMKRALTERFGGELDVDGRTYRAFPDHTKLREAKPSELLQATGSQRATQRLTSLLASFEEELDEDLLRSAPYEKASARLQRVKGIGEWSSQFILFRGLGRIEELQPINLKFLTKAIEKVYGQKGRTLEEINSTYGSWAGYWSLYMWAFTMGGGMERGTTRD